MKANRNWKKEDDSSEIRGQHKGSRQRRLQVLRAHSQDSGEGQKLRLMLRMRRRKLTVVKDTKETDK